MKIEDYNKFCNERGYLEHVIRPMREVHKYADWIKEGSELFFGFDKWFIIHPDFKEIETAPQWEMLIDYDILEVR